MTPEELQQIATWAAHLAPEEVERAARGVSVRAFTRGSYVCHRGYVFDHWTGVVSGLCKLATISPDGKAISYTGIPAGGWFGEGSIIKNEPRKYDIVAVRDSEIALMNGTTFRWLFEHSTAFNRFLVYQLNERLGQFIGMLGYDRMLDATGRMARTIAWLFNPLLFPGVGDRLEINQEELGQLSGLSRQAANRALRALQERGLLELDAQGIRALDKDGLSHFGD
ncbi:MAG: Crp/Fnr family transcriptional regulator [Rhodobiaceae bacterium]|nr:Crp/Fnr family transcriptional regulator [Rhodobiaceae bacterium]MCB1477757.1 Crp/Fnr family transcriptional regulator [Rhodobiaceae bacterium]MCC0015528.1 Crp/Fnr family transcriptional regulator [Rhodobiaceae bacterium]MCC0040906.1 Crp/Fnr family transcriptional regulator [Rhodobiaceae bacterium]MCC0053233.1 Crp/Fnr family transcriptional regulator [Rhodobiaceae bacterium]